MLKAPHLASCSSFYFLEGNILDFKAPPEKFTHIIHGATEASAELNEHDPLLMYSTIVEGTQRILEVARQIPTARLLFLSSGAVYGAQPWDMERVGEDFLGGPDPTVARNAYGEAKRASEMLCAIFHKQFGVVTVIARIFTLLGPYLSLGTHFAAGNFISDAMHGRPITVNGNGLPRRSYMYAGDLVVWLLHLLCHGKPSHPYNVGSERSVSIAELAQAVADVLGDGRTTVLGAADQGWNPGRYIPSTSRMREEFGVRETVDLKQSILRTAIWNGWKGKSQ
jgi:dTDP-glucose 4,6-dehydratase